MGGWIAADAASGCRRGARASGVRRGNPGEACTWTRTSTQGAPTTPCGTAIECSLTGTLQLVLRKRADLPGTPLESLDLPMIGTQDDWVVSGFSYPSYLADLGAGAQTEIFGRSLIGLALRDAFRKMRGFLMGAKGLTEDEAISLMSVAVDFGVTQVVDGNWGVHAIMKKDIFAGAAG